MTDLPFERLSSALSGRYTLERELGAGGMATVYLATDVKHSRPVAVKVLHPELAAVVGAERFLGEIETTANLQHPHILPLFDSGEADGFLFYVMPYVKGESLRERLDRERQLPVDQAVEMARKIASALQHAHEKGVVHRDIKPANILLSEGEPLVADFGIALAVSSAGGGRITETGLSLGTPHYMSPEQASGDRSLDPRSDVYALGCVLYEMLTGEPPFPGPTPQAVLARILTSAPQRTVATRHTVPPHVDAAVARSLEKLPADRFDSLAGFRKALEDPDFRHVDRGATESITAPTRSGAARRTTRRGRWVLAGAAAALAGVAFFAGRVATPEPERTVVRFRVGVPEDVTSVSFCCGPAQALSPDGEWLVFVGGGRAGRFLYRRRLGQLEAERIPGTEGASIPFFSPDGRWVGFHADDRLRKVPMSGGPAVPIADVVRVDGASWGDNDVIVFRDYGEGLMTVPAAGGTPTPVPGTEESRYIHPWMLPGGEAALARIEGPGSNQDARFVAVDLATGEADTLGFGTRATYAAGHLVVSGADATLLAQPFDPRRRRTTGPAVAILDGIGLAGPAIGEFGLSADGGLVYQSGGLNLNETLMIHGRGGAAEIPLLEPGNYEDPSFAPDGRRIAVRIAPDDVQGQIWIWDRDQRTQQLLTVGGEENFSPVWTPDGSRIAFARRGEEGPVQIHWQPADGSGAAEVLLGGEAGTEERAVPSDFSPDGGSLVFTGVGEDDQADVGLLDLADRTVRWLVETAAADYQGQISPDGRWLAYTSERSGQPEVYVQALDGTGGRTQISAGGGSSARWAPDGQTLYYATGEGQPVLAAAVSADGRFRVTAREEAFEGIDDLNVPGSTTWDVSPDGEEFLYISRGGAGGVEGFVWILNWPEIIRGLQAGRP